MGGHIRSFASKQVLLTATAQEIVGPSDRRSGLIIMPPLNGTVYIGTDNTITIGNGISLHHDSGPLSLFREQVGDLVRRGLWAVGLAAWGSTRDFAVNRVSASDGGAGLRTASIAAIPGYHFAVDGFAVSNDKNEYANFTVLDGAGVVYLTNYYYGNLVVSLVKPFYTTVSQLVGITGTQSATSTRVDVSIWGRQMYGTRGFSEALNLSVIEIFDCDCQQVDVPSIINYIDRRK